MNLILRRVRLEATVVVLKLCNIMTERQEEKIKRDSLTAEVEHKVKQQLSQVLNDAQVNYVYNSSGCAPSI